MKKGKLILFPVAIGGELLEAVLPTENKRWLETCHTFIVEEIRTARRFLKRAGYPIPIDDVTFFELNEHTSTNDIGSYLEPIADGNNVGLLSEAGLPCIADPGAVIVAIAQRRAIEVLPLVGPSSLLLALMASGLNGQSFAFNGYLPVDRSRRYAALRHLEDRVWREHQTQLFIEAPYRNNQMLEALCATLRSDTLICVACDITLPSQIIRTLPCSQWKTERLALNLHKRNTVFLIGSPQ